MKRLGFLGAMNRDIVATIPADTILSAIAPAAVPLVETAISDAMAVEGTRLLLDGGGTAILGGSAFNVARVASLLNAGDPALDLAFLGIAGRVNGHWPHIVALRNWHVDLSAVRRSTLPPATCLAMVEPQGRTLLTAIGANAGIADLLQRDHERLATAAAGCDVLHVTSFLDPATPALIATLAARARDLNPGFRLSLDPGSAWVMPGGPGFERLLAQTSILHLNSEEFAHFAVPAADLLARLAPGPAMIVARTHFGATIYQRDAEGLVTEHHLPETPLPPPEEIRDATGAGDTFCAAFLWSWLGRSAPLETAAAHAFSLARHKVGQNGPLSAIPDVLTQP